MALIWETPNFIIESHEQPFVSREEGGHIRVKIKDASIVDRTMLSVKQAREYMRITMIVGKALERAMNKRGVKVIKVNYQDMGNWAYKEGKISFMHCQIFGRILGAKHQPYPESVYLPDRKSGFYDSFLPLNEDDIKAIQKEIRVISNEAKYRETEWHL